MNAPHASACPLSDDVLARHLDGQPASEGKAANGESANGGEAAATDAHLEACAQCQQVLRRARRLDAVLAHEAGQFVANCSDGLGASEARWFAAVAAATAPALANGGERPAATVDDLPSDDASTPRTAPNTFRTLVLAGVALLLATAWLVSRQPGEALQPRPEEPAAVTPTRVTANELAPDDRGPDDRGRDAPGAVALDLRRLPKWKQAAPSPEGSNPATAATTHKGQRPASAPRQVDVVALRRLLDQGGVTDAELVQAAQVADDDVDDALRRHLRRNPRRLDTAVAALRSVPRPQGTARLLLDLWDDGVCRDRLADDESTAARLFDQQRAATFAELQQELANSPHANRRWRCLLALGRSRDVDVTQTLLAHLESPRREEALVAAFALSCLPGPRLVALTQWASPSFLLRASLLRSQAAELAAYAAHCGEPLELRQRLRGAPLPLFFELASGRRHVADASE